jgi:hypothetical protein
MVRDLKTSLDRKCTRRSAGLSHIHEDIASSRASFLASRDCKFAGTAFAEMLEKAVSGRPPVLILAVGNPDMKQPRHFENVTPTTSRGVACVKTLIEDMQRVVILLEDDAAAENERSWLFGSGVFNSCEGAGRTARQSERDDRHARNQALNIPVRLGGIMGHARPSPGPIVQATGESNLER